MGYTTDGKYGGRIILPSYDKEDKLNYWVGRTYNNQKPKYLNPDSDKEEVIFAHSYNIQYCSNIS